MTQIKKLGFGVVAVALFAVMAMATMVSTAEANVNAITRSPASVALGGTSTITISADTFEVQSISAGDRTGGTFTLSYAGQTTAAIASNASATDIALALEALSNITDVEATGGPVGAGGAAVVVTFVNPTGNIAQMTVNGASLTGGTTDPAVTTTTQGQGTGGILTVVASSGTLAAQVCGTVACTGVTGNGTAQLNIPNVGNDLRTVEVQLTAPGTGSGSITVTAIQNGVSQNATVTLLGSAASVEVVALEAAPGTPASTCNGQVASAITGNGVTNGLASSVLCAIVTDSAGNRISGATVIFSTTEGQLSANSVTANANGRAAGPILSSTATAVAGDVATITATSGGASGTTTVRFAGEPASCTVTAPAGTGAGGSAAVTVNVVDTQGGIVADNAQVTVQAVHAGTGQNVALIPAGGVVPTENGIATVTLVSAIQGSIAIVASTPSVPDAVNCTGTLLVQGTATPTTPTGDGSLTAPNFGTGNVGSAVFAGGSIEQLADAAADAGGTAVWVQGTNGNWYRYSIGATGATAFVNNAFNTQFAAGFAGATPVFVVK